MKEKLIKIFVSSLLLLLIFLFSSIARAPNHKKYEISFLDVGQGDSTLIQKGDQQILIDGGPDDKVLTELGKEMPLTDRKIEIIVLTHPHADHLAGIIQILDRYEVGKVYSSGVLSSSNQYLEFLNKIKEKSIPFIVPKTNETINLDGASLEFLWPGDKYFQKTEENLNNTSIVSKFCVSLDCVLLTGDIEKEEQDVMFGYYNSIAPDIFKSKIIKVPHHGSQNAANPTLYELVLPKVAVISAGKDNMYKHPHQVTLDLLKSFNIQTKRTDQDGTVSFDLSGQPL